MLTEEKPVYIKNFVEKTFFKFNRNTVTALMVRSFWPKQFLEPEKVNLEKTKSFTSDHEYLKGASTYVLAFGGIFDLPTYPNQIHTLLHKLI